MSFPPPPGLPQPQPPRSSSSSSHPSLPPRPPTTSFTKPGAPGASASAGGYGNHGAASGRTSSTGYNAFTGFQPRAVAASQPYRTHSPVISSPATPIGGYPTAPATTVAAQTTYSSGYQQPPQQYGQFYGQSAATPQIQNPFPAPRPGAHNTSTSTSGYGTTTGNRGYPRHTDPNADPETEAQIMQWQSAYWGKEAEPAQTTVSGSGKMTPAAGFGGIMNQPATSTPPVGQQTTTASSSTAVHNAPADPSTAGKTVLRSGGGQTWSDSTLLEWDPSHFRLFAGNLAGEVTDDSLLKAFSQYPSVQKARVIRDKRTEKSRGFGFISFSDSDDYFRAAREMQGKYIGSHPVLLRRANTEVKPTALKHGNKGGRKGGSGGGHRGGGGGGKDGKGARVAEGGIQKKQSKTKGGLRVLG